MVSSCSIWLFMNFSEMRECRRHSFCWEKRQRSAFLSCCQFSFWSCMSLVHSSLKSQELTKRKLMKLDFFLSSSHLLYSFTSSFYRISFVNLCVILSHTLPFNDNLFPVILDKEWEVKFHGDLVLNTKLRESKGVDFIDCMPFCSRKHWPDSQVAASGKKQLKEWGILLPPVDYSCWWTISWITKKKSHTEDDSDDDDHERVNSLFRENLYPNIFIPTAKWREMMKDKKREPDSSLPNRTCNNEYLGEYSRRGGLDENSFCKKRTTITHSCLDSCFWYVSLFLYSVVSPFSFRKEKRKDFLRDANHND